MAPRPFVPSAAGPGRWHPGGTCLGPPRVSPVPSLSPCPAGCHGMLRKTTRKVKALQPLGTDIGPRSLHSPSYNVTVLRGKGKLVLPPAASPGQGWRALRRDHRWRPPCLGVPGEGRRTPSSCTALCGKVRSPAAMARAQGRPTAESPKLLGKLEHLQTPAVGFLSPRSDLSNGAIHPRLPYSQ